MKDKTLFNTFKVFLHVIVVLLIINGIFGVILIKDTFNKCESCMIYNPEIKDGLNGVWHQDKYYCVWTDGRSSRNIQSKEYHEACHQLVYEDLEKFNS